MNEMIGVIFLIIILISIIKFTADYLYLRNILLVAFILRFIALIINHYEFVVLPDSQGDALRFERIAVRFSRNEGLLILLDFFQMDSLLISRIISVFYTVFGESKIMAHSISVALGTASVILVYYLSLILWDFSSAKKAAWLTAIFPTLILYSALTLREVYIVFFLLIGCIGIANYFKNYSLFSFLQSMFCFYIIMLMHPPSGIGFMIFLIYAIIKLIKNQLIKLYDLKVNLISLIKIFLGLGILIFIFIYKDVKIRYFGNLGNLLDLKYLVLKSNLGHTDVASYPTWLLMNNNYEFFSKGILKIIYFLYSPFLWDLKNSFHIIGFFDAMLYMVLTIYIIKNYKSISTNSIIHVFLLILLTYAIIFGIGIGNFGTGIRHRSKFVVIFIILAAPKIQKFIFSFKKKLYKQ